MNIILCISNNIGELERLLHKRLFKHRSRAESNVFRHISVGITTKMHYTVQLIENSRWYFFLIISYNL
jgi:hypothetical protein